MTSTLRGDEGIRENCDIIGRKWVGVSECSGLPIFIFFFLLKKTGFAP